MFKEYIIEKQEAELFERFGVSATQVDKKFRGIVDYFNDNFNVQRLAQKAGIVSIDIESNLSSGELEEIEDEFLDFVFSINRKTHIIHVEEA